MRAILTYHSIDASGSPVSCHPDVFERHVRWMSSGCVQVTAIEDLIALPPVADALAIAFDDGFANFKDLAAPRLLAHGLPSTVFVVADQAGRTNAWRGRPERGIPHLPLLDWAALASLREQGVMLGSHSRTHPDLTRLGRRALEDEIAGSAEIMQRETGCRPSLFAYPYGRVERTAAGLVASVYRYGCTTEFRMLDAAMQRARIPRLDAYYFDRPGLLESWGTPAFEAFVRTRRRLRRLRRAAAGLARVLRLSPR